MLKNQRRVLKNLFASVLFSSFLFLLFTSNVAASICGINYYPKDKFQHFLQNFDRTQAEYDLGVMQGLGVKTVRIFLPWEGGASYAGQFGDFLSLADSKGIKVIPSLLDVSNFPCDWQTFQGGYRDNVRSYVEAGKNSPAVLAWDLKNEPSCGGALDDNAIAGLRWMAGVVKAIDSRPITVGLKSEHVDKISSMLDFLDIVQVHDYWDIPKTIATAQRAKDLAGGKPVMMGEFGVPSSGGDQASYYNSVLPALSNMGIEYLNPWTFIDFTQDMGDESHYGLFDVNYAIKSGGDSFKTFCGGSGTMPPGNPPAGNGDGQPPVPPAQVSCRPAIKSLGSPARWDPAWHQGLPGYAKDAFADLGSRYVKIGFEWSQIELTHGTFQYNRNEAPFDTILSTFTGAGITPVGLFVAAPTWLDMNDTQCQADNMYCDITDEAVFRNAVKNIIEHYKNIKYWEFWNEPDQYKNGLNNPTTYQKWLNIFYDEVKTIDSTIKVGASTGSGGSNSVSHWFSPIAQTAKYDALVVHPYSGPNHEGPLDRVEVQSAKGVAKPGTTLWVSEWGFNMDSISEDTQVAQVQDGLNWLNSQSYVELAFFHSLVDDRLSDSDYGLMLEDFFEKGLAGTKRKAYDVFKAGMCSNPAAGVACAAPIPANPEPGCFNCNFKGNTSNQAPPSPIAAFIGDITSFLIRQAAQLGVNYNATVKVQDIKAPVTENDLARWYGKVGSDGKVKDNTADVGRLAYFLSPEDAKNALDQGNKYKDTISLIEYATEPQGNISATYGYGSTKQIYGAQNAASVIECMLTGTPDDPECKTTNADLAMRTDNYLALINDRENNLALEKDRQAAYAQGQEKALEKTAASLSEQQKSYLLASADAVSALSTQPASSNETEGSVLSYGVPNFGSCPEKKESPITALMCPNTYQDGSIQGVVKHEWYTDVNGQATNPSCNTTETLNSDGTAANASGGCSFSDKQRVSISPRFSFATGTTYDDQLGFIPALNKLHAIFWDPDFTISEEQKQKVKEKNDGKVPFVPVIVTNAHGVTALTGVIQSIVNAVFQVDANSNYEANIENNKKRECYEKILEQSQLMPPELAQPIDPDCIEPKPDTPTDFGDFSTACGAGVFDWNNSNTVGGNGTTLPLTSFGSLVGKLQGKVILADGATLVLYGKQVPKNAGNGLPGHKRCGYDNGGNPPRVKLYRVDKNATSWANASVYLLDYDVLPTDRPYHLKVDLSVPEGKYAFVVEGDACWSGIGGSGQGDNIDSIPIANAITITSGGSATQCFNVTANSVMPGGHDGTLGNNSEDIAPYCGLDYDTSYNSMCGGEKPTDMGGLGCSDPAANCSYLRQNVPGWPQTGNSCREMFPSKFKRVACNAESTTLANLRMYDISCVDEDKCFIAANKVSNASDLNADEQGAYFVKSTSNGAWSAKPFVYTDPAGGLTALQAVFRIRFIGQNNGYAVGKSPTGQVNLVLKTTDGGENWNLMARQTANCDRQNLISLDMLSDSSGIIGPTSTDVIWNLTDPYTWSRSRYTLSNAVYDVCSITIPNTFECQTTAPSNTNPATAPSCSYPHDSFIDLSMIDGNNVMAATNRGFVVKLAKQGGVWSGSETNVCPVAGRMEKVRMVSGSLGYAAGRDGCTIKYDGNQWVNLPGFPAASYLGLGVYGSGLTLFTGSNGTIALLKGGGGAPLTPSSGVNTNLWGASIVNNQVMYAVGDGGVILKSSDGGTSWARQMNVTMQN